MQQMQLNKETRQELMEVMTAAIRAAGVGRTEKFVTGKRLCEMFQMFTLSRLKSWGETLPRIRATFVSEDGKSEQSGWAYNVAEIQKMIDRNELVFVMKEKECVYRTSRRGVAHVGKVKRNGNALRTAAGEAFDTAI